MPVTQKDIAQKLNLSQSLIAGVLNDRPGIWVSEENRRRILDAAQELNYRPNAAARALRRGKTNLVACVFFGSAGHHALIETLADRLTEIGYDLLVKVIPDPEQAESRLGSLLGGGVCDAVALWGLENESEATALRLEECGMPFVVKGRFEDRYPHWFQVDFDHEGMMAQAVRHLVERGHQRIAYLGYGNGFIYERKLADGFRQAMLDAYGHPVREDFLGEVENELNSVKTRLAQWLELPPVEQPTAVVIGTGRVAWDGFERGLARLRRRIGEGPGDLAVVGLGGIDAPLLFGEGDAYKNTELADLSNAMARLLLAPLLCGDEPDSRVIRLLPALCPYPTLNLPLPATIPDTL